MFQALKGNIFPIGRITDKSFITLFNFDVCIQGANKNTKGKAEIFVEILPIPPRPLLHRHTFAIDTINM
jgi:hypothetical protein